MSLTRIIREQDVDLVMIDVYHLVQSGACSVTGGPGAGIPRVEAVDRDPETIVLSYQHRLRADDLSSSDSELQRFTPDGATQVVFILPVPYPDRIVTRVAEEVIANVGA